MKRVLFALDVRTHDSTGKSLSEFKLVRGNTLIGDKDTEGHVRGRFGKQTFLFTDPHPYEILAVFRAAIRTGFKSDKGEVPEWKLERARKLKEFLNARPAAVSKVT